MKCRLYKRCVDVKFLEFDFCIMDYGYVIKRFWSQEMHAEVLWVQKTIEFHREKG